MEPPAAPSLGEGPLEDGPGEEGHRTVVAAGLQANLDREAQQFELVWTIVMLCKALYQLVVSAVLKMNNFPAATGFLSIAVHVLAFLARRCCGRRIRRLMRSQAWHAVAILVDATLFNIANPETQFAMYHTSMGPMLERMFGRSPKCPPLSLTMDGRCFFLYESLQNSILAFTACVFYVIFVLDFRHSIVVLVSWFASFHAVRLWVRWTLLPLQPLELIADMCYTLPINLMMVAAKWKINKFQQQLMVELARKHGEVVQEKVKRCQVEFQFQTMGAREEVRHSQTPSNGGSAVASSGPAFQAPGLEDSEAMQAKLREMAQLGRQEHWLIEPQDVMLQPSRVLGRGCFGVVLTGSFVGSPVAVKFARNCGGGNGMLQLANELRTFRHVRHPNIALFHGACFEPLEDTLALVLELVEGTDLEAYMRPGGAAQLLVSDSARCKILLDICRALNYLHTRRPCIIHGDVKPPNMIVEHVGQRASPRVKLLDFGLARVMTAHARPLGGTLLWMAPEVFLQRGQQHTSAADVYSFGRVAFFVVTGRKPFTEGPGTRRVLERSLRSAEPPPLGWPATRLAARCQLLANRCMHILPSTRPGLGEVHEDLVRWPQDLGVPDLGGHAGLLEGGASRSWSEALDDMLQQSSEAESVAGRHAGAAAADPRAATLSRGGAAGGALAGAAQAPSRTTLATLSENGGSSWVAPAGFRHTPAATKQAILRDAILRWHGDAAAGSCCAYHDALEHAVTLCRELLASDCRPLLVEDAQRCCWQCPSCWALGDAAEDGRGVVACAVCNQRAPGWAQPAEAAAAGQQIMEL